MKWKQSEKSCGGAEKNGLENAESRPSSEKKRSAEHPDVGIPAVHHRAGAKKAEEFLAGRGWEYIGIALDSKGKGIMQLLNASDAITQTIILNPQKRFTILPAVRLPGTEKKDQSASIRSTGSGFPRDREFRI